MTRPRIDEISHCVITRRVAIVCGDHASYVVAMQRVITRYVIMAARSWLRDLD